MTRHKYGNYTLLRRGDHLPTVGVLQKLLSRAGFHLDADGAFGRETLAAVRHYQRANRLSHEGVVGKATWAHLIRGLSLQILDCVDIYDAHWKEQLARHAPKLRNDRRKYGDRPDLGKIKAAKMMAYLSYNRDRTDSEKQESKLELDQVSNDLEWYLQWYDTDKPDLVELLEELRSGANSYTGEAADLLNVGAAPILIGGASNGVEAALNNVYNAAHVGEVFLLRFHGHGTPAGGVMGISDGTLNVDAYRRTSLDLLRIEGRRAGQDSNHPEEVKPLRPELIKLAKVFGWYGSCELKACWAGKGPDGKKLLESLANYFNVPVTASTDEQEQDTFLLKGNTVTAIPKHDDGSEQTLREWCHNLPDFPPIKETRSHHINPTPRGADPKDYGAGTQGRYRRGVIGVDQNAP